jgi:hypothetical protein
MPAEAPYKGRLEPLDVTLVMTPAAGVSETPAGGAEVGAEAPRAEGALTLVSEPCGGVDTSAQPVVLTPIPCVLALPLTRRTLTDLVRTHQR